MGNQSELFAKAAEKIDEANSQDPKMEMVDGQEVPSEVIYGQRMSARLNEYVPDASEQLQLACRGQHIRRWEIPRKDYPMDRKGYNQWRIALYSYHAEKTGEILRELGYDEAFASRAETIIRKERPKLDPEVQQLEDVACLVFLEHYSLDFAGKHAEDKIISIIQKTWKKMSEPGHAAALKLSLPGPVEALVKKALA